MARPIRLYQHTFTREGSPKLDIVRSGCTPCQARAAAFLALERKLVEDHLPRGGWRLTTQKDVTHLASW